MRDVINGTNSELFCVAEKLGYLAEGLRVLARSHELSDRQKDVFDWGADFLYGLDWSFFRNGRNICFSRDIALARPFYYGALRSVSQQKKDFGFYNNVCALPDVLRSQGSSSDFSREDLEGFAYVFDTMNDKIMAGFR